jgi:hypothetical protein
MLKVITLAAIAALAVTVTAAPQPAFARDGGAVAAGAIIGSQVNRGYYGGPGYYESGYQPGYRECHTERQAIEDGYGNVRMRRVRVCD